MLPTAASAVVVVIVVSYIWYLRNRRAELHARAIQTRKHGMKSDVADIQYADDYARDVIEL
jgi:hypothetical protein